MDKVRIEWGPLAFFTGVTVLGLTAGTVVGGVFTALGAGFLLFALFDGGLLFLTARQLRALQTLQARQVARGGHARLTLVLENGLRLPSARMDLTWQLWGSDGQTVEEGATLWLKPREHWEQTWELPCPRRGRFAFGLQRLTLVSAFAWVEIDLPVDRETLTVLPRVRPLPADPADNDQDLTEARISAQGQRPDPLLWDWMDAYRPGEDLRGADWKSLARGGLLRLRRPAREEPSPLAVTLDCWAPQGSDEAADQAVELALALALQRIKDGETSRLNFPGGGGDRYILSNLSAWDTVREAAAGWRFSEEPPRQSGSLEGVLVTLSPFSPVWQAWSGSAPQVWLYSPPGNPPQAKDWAQCPQRGVRLWGPA